MCPNVNEKHARRSCGIFPLIVLIIVCVISANLPTVSPLELEEFYPFNNITDNQTNRRDDGGSGKIELQVVFPFFNRSFKQIYVNNNGIISFRSKFEQSYKPELFPELEDKTLPLVAPFWADVDIQNVVDQGEAVYYRETNESSLLDRASQDIRSYFVSLKTFQAVNIFIATWYKVGFYGAEGDEGKSKRNTFQCVLVTDGQLSFVIFNYYKIVWTTGSNSQGQDGDSTTGLGGKAAVVGFNSGIEGKYYMVEGSGTADILNLTRTSNVGIPGKYVFRVDDETIGKLGCEIDRYSFSISPRSGPMLGWYEILASGPCFIQNDDNNTSDVVARLLELNLTFPCTIVTETTVSCVIPTLFRTGQFTFQLNKFGSGWNYQTTFTSIHLSQMTPKLIRKNPDHWSVGNMVTLSWSEDVPSNGTKNAQVMGYYMQENVPVFETIQNLSVQAALTSLKFKLDSPLYANYSTLIVHLCWQRPEASQLCIWSDVFPVRWNKQQASNEWCQNWLNVENSLPNITHRTSICPCVLSQAERDIGRFQIDPFCDNTNDGNSLNCLFHKDASQCMRRSLQSPTGGGEMCCYDKSGELLDIRADSSGGVQQRYHYRAQGGNPFIVPYFSYFEEDLLPYLHCCQYSGDRDLCFQFLEYRPPTTCQGYEPPTPAQAAGDPHLVSLDGKNYTFNGIGDFILVIDSNSTVMVQVRAEQATDKEGKRQNATVFTSVAVCAINVSDVIEIRIVDEGTEVLVNKGTFIPESSTSQFDGISLEQSGDNSSAYSVILESVSLSVTIEATPDLLNIIVLVGEDSFRGNLRGLLGNYNSDPEDDFISRNGTKVPIDSSMSDVHYLFGETWRVQEDELILALSGTQSAADIHSYKPVFIDKLDEANITTAVLDLCGTNLLCVFDYVVTGKESVAEATKSFSSKFDALKKELNEKVVRCPFLSIPENGNRTVDSYGVGAKANFTCNSGFEIVTGDSQRECQEDGSWSGKNVMCATRTKQSGTGANYMAYVYIIGGSSAALVLVAVIALIGVCLCRRRTKVHRECREFPLDPLHLFPSSPDSSSIPVFENPAFLLSLQRLSENGVFRIPRPSYVDPQIFQEYF